MQKESRLYYSHLGRIQGDSCQYKGIVYKEDERIEHVFDHRDHDGISAMIKILKEHDLFYSGIFKGLKSRKKPKWMTIFKAFISFRLSMPYRPKVFKRGELISSTIIESEMMLTELETKEIYNICREAKITFNAYLLFHIKELLKNYTENSERKMIFMLPVNLRDTIDESNDFGNDVSFVDIMIGDEDSAQSIQNQIVQKFTRRLQWGAWLATKMIGFFPKFLHEFLIKDYIKSTHRTGLVSSMGIWDYHQKYIGTTLNAIPVNFSHMPFSISAVDWQKRLNFGLSLNPNLGLAETEAKIILNHLKNRLLQRDHNDL